MSDRREEIAKKYVPCRCDVIYASRGLAAPDCPFHSTDPESAMDEYFTERAMELLEYMANNYIRCMITNKDEIVFIHRGNWLTKEQLFENFL